MAGLKGLSMRLSARALANMGHMATPAAMDGLGEHVEQVVGQVVLGQGLRLAQVGQEEPVGLEGDRDGQGLEELGARGVDNVHPSHAAQTGHVLEGAPEQGTGGAPRDDDADDRDQRVGDVGVDGHGVAAPQASDDGQQQEAGHGRGDDSLADDLRGRSPQADDDSLSPRTAAGPRRR